MIIGPPVHVHVVPRNRKDGLRGFFWPRTAYDNEAHASETRDRIAKTIQQIVDLS